MHDEVLRDVHMGTGGATSPETAQLPSHRSSILRPHKYLKSQVRRLSSWVVSDDEQVLSRDL